MKLKSIIVDADAPLSLIIQRLQANDYYGNFNMKDGDNVARFDNVDKKKYIYLYFHNNTFQNHIKRMKDIVTTIEMPYTNNPIFESKLIGSISVLSCYIVDEIDNKVIMNNLRIKKASYTFLYSFAYSLKDKKIALFKPAFYSSTKHKMTNELLRMMFNIEYPKKKKPSK